MQINIKKYKINNRKEKDMKKKLFVLLLLVVMLLPTKVFAYNIRDYEETNGVK